MEKEDLVIALQSRFGLTEPHLTIDFRNQEDQVRVTYDLNGYKLKRPLNLDTFWGQLQNLPSTQTKSLDGKKKEATVKRQELEHLLSQLDPPIQA